jgi:photosystem II stability/assembly factor-like uncharacterized protein
MKKFLTIFLSAFSILINAQSDPNIKWIHPSPQGNDIKWMKMWDANNWYLGGLTGLFMKTTDAGLNWTTNNRAGWPNTTYPDILTNWQGNSAWFFDQNNGIVVGNNSPGILRTTDGGETFDTLRILPGSSTGKNLFGIHFVNSNLGFICGSTAYKIQKTTDGGTTWTELPNLPDGAYSDVFATNELNIIACGPSVSSQAALYKTTDGGINWNTILLPTIQTLTDLEFINATTGYVCGGAGFFKSTTDGGATWTGGTNTPLGANNYKIRTSGGDIYVAGNSNNLFKSTDNGGSWITLNMNPTGGNNNPNYCMDVVGSNLVVAGIRGYLYKSTNGGTDWNLLTQRATEASFLRSFYVENTSGKIIVAGRLIGLPGAIIISDDGGNSWQTSPFIPPGESAIERMQMFNNNDGYFSGRYGYFAKTTDGGLNLTQIVIPFAGINFLYDMDFLNQSLGWVVGGIPNGGGIVAKTTDGGLTWTDQTPAGITGVGYVDFVDANIGYISSVGDFRKTTNGGSSWVTIPIPGISGSVNSIKAFDANNVYIKTTDGQFAKTTNGGTNWQLVPVPFPGYSYYNRGQAWYDMNNGFIYGVFGAIAKTTDAGLTWETMNTGGESIAGGIMVHPDTFYVGSFQYAQIFRYAKPSAQTTFQLSVNVANGWNMVSTPGLNSPDQSVNTWWPSRDLSANVFKYLGGYQSVTTTIPGIGYWMKNAGATTYNTGDEWPAGGIQIVAHDPLIGASGWNLIGGYEISATASLVTTVPPGLQSGPIYKYSGGYQVATTIDPGYGYWIKLTGTGQIIIPETLAKGKETIIYFPDDWGKITITDAAGISYTLYAVKGKIDLNQYELPPVPIAEMFDIRYSSGRIAEDLSNSQFIEMQGIAYPVKVKVENVNITLQDETGKELQTQLKPGEQIIISDNTVNKLKVMSGELITPIEYALEQNYPNPFNPSTMIKFSLPEASDVTLIIYNTLGQKVTELVNTKLDAGRYSYQWNASNVSTGMYIYELRADKFVSVKKMILLK